MNPHVKDILRSVPSTLQPLYIYYSYIHKSPSSPSALLDSSAPPACPEDILRWELLCSRRPLPFRATALAGEVKGVHSLKCSKWNRTSCVVFGKQRSSELRAVSSMLTHGVISVCFFLFRRGFRFSPVRQPPTSRPGVRLRRTRDADHHQTVGDPSFIRSRPSTEPRRSDAWAMARLGATERSRPSLAERVDLPNPGGSECLGGPDLSHTPSLTRFVQN